MLVPVVKMVMVVPVVKMLYIYIRRFNGPERHEMLTMINAYYGYY